jgi:putative transposase
MARAYSMDLRERAVRAVEVEGLSRRAAAVRYGLGVSTVIKWLQRVCATGSARPGKMGGHKPKKIAGAHRTWLLTRCRERDFTLRGLLVELGERGLTAYFTKARSIFGKPTSGLIASDWAGMPQRGRCRWAENQPS